MGNWVSINDTNVSLTVSNTGGVVAVKDALGHNSLYIDYWIAGIRSNDSNSSSSSSSYDFICGVGSDAPNFGNLSHNDSWALSLVNCSNSSVSVTHEFQRSLSSQIMKANVIFFHNGTTAYPALHYRRITYFIVGNDTKNYMTSLGQTNSSKLVSSYLTNDTCSEDITIPCNNTIGSPPNDTKKYAASYEFQFGPIIPNESVSFQVFYGVGAGEVDAFTAMCLDGIEVGSVWKPANSYQGLPYSSLVGYSGVGGNPKTFCPSPSPPGGGGHGGICFSSANTVEEQSRGIIPIGELQIGDYVRTGTGVFTQVYGFGHLDHHREESFIQLHFAIDNSSNDIIPTVIEISSDHLIFVDDRTYPIRASSVVVDDFLSGRKVINVKDVVRQGVYAPLTMSGDIAVNGVRASNYVDLIGYGHAVGHAAFVPQRLFCHYNMDTCRNETYTNGYGSYTRFVISCAYILQNLEAVTTRCAAVVANMPALTTTPMIVEWMCFLFIASIALKTKNTHRRNLIENFRQKKPVRVPS